jgi:hypothetical protein
MPPTLAELLLLRWMRGRDEGPMRRDFVFVRQRPDDHLGPEPLPKP